MGRYRKQCVYDAIEDLRLQGQFRELAEGH